ncbi:MAG: CHAD domain-containing protein [Capsulimonadales bacterium]|nr:CHAD domain-containing protein [Capsulimonadales bacterium]
MAKAVPIHKLTHPDQKLGMSAPVLLVRLNEMLEWAAAVHDPACVEELHNMRISAKRLRYTMELFLPALDPAAAGVLRTVEEIQGQLGDIHDCDVLLPVLRETMEDEMERERKKALRAGNGPPPFLAAEGLIALQRRKQEERRRRYEKFIAYWDALPPEEFADRLRHLVLQAARHDNSER